MRLFAVKEDLDLLHKHAADESPHECIGLFVIVPYDDKGSWLLSQIIPCNSVSRVSKDESAQISRVKVKNFDKRLRKFESIGWRYGTYHSHPKFGICGLSEKDDSIGRIYKQYRFQIIIASGIVGFWAFDRKTKKWKKGRIKTL